MQNTVREAKKGGRKNNATTEPLERMNIDTYQAISVRNDMKIIEDPNSTIHSFIALRKIGIPSTFCAPEEKDSLASTSRQNPLPSSVQEENKVS